ncbi:hypothetical protein MMC16_005592 [Acarospora aff. strigata]|nr:hypothetical protein [Acarospora aff. strigata]
MMHHQQHSKTVRPAINFIQLNQLIQPFPTTLTTNMQFLTISALALTLIGRCFAEPIRADLHRAAELDARSPSSPFNNLLVNAPNAF